jgi:hypothetical protein
VMTMNVCDHSKCRMSNNNQVISLYDILTCMSLVLSKKKLRMGTEGNNGICIS